MLSIVRGMQKAVPSLYVFLDVLDLRSGQYWRQELDKALARSDVFYLFWCRHAKDSKEVESEWRRAFESKGLDFIIEYRSNIRPKRLLPLELAARHFYDALLGHISHA